MSGVPTATWIGRELASGRYRVDALLGEGGMGAVYRARDRNLGTDVVVKVPHASMLQDAEFGARFAHEISSLVRLSHPHIVKISDVGEQDSLPFAVMQFLPGGSLEDRQKTGPNREARSLPPDSLKAWLPSIAEALDFVHSQGYIHRDVKPANILFDAHGHAYLSDFGIAKSAVTGQPASTKTLTGSGMVIGTPEYMAPELIMGQSCDGRVDQYALAVTVFEMLAGRRPFEDPTSTALYVQHATAEPPDLAKLSPDVSSAIATAIHRALSKSPEQRFASCRAFATVLLGAAETFTASQLEAVDTKCPVCQSSLKLADRMRGKQLRCAGCHSLLDVSDDLRLMPVLSSANETVVRATTRFASGTRGQAIISPVEADNSYRLQRDQDSQNKGSEPVPKKSSASATQRAASLGEATSRSMSGKTMRPSMLPSPKTKSLATQHERQTTAEPLMSVVGKLLSQFKSDFQAYSRRHSTLITVVVWVLVLASIPPLMMLIFKTDESSVDAKLQSDSSAKTSASQPADANQPSPPPPPPPPIAPKPAPHAGEERDDNSLKMKFCWCPPGTFTMGSPVTEVDRNKNEDQVSVTLTKGFWMGKFEVTQGEWQQTMGTTLTQQKVKSKTNTYGEITGRGARHPMYFVNYDEATDFCVKLSEQERHAGRLPNDWRYRLPTEAQWEYACRAETLTATAFGNSLNSTLANFNGNFPTGSASKGPNLNRTTEVGSYKPNGWGLCDMHGNVIECCEDWYVEKFPGGRDPAASQASGVEIKVARSGAWNSPRGQCRSAFRSAYLPGSRHASVGFRVALVPEELGEPKGP